VAGSAMLSLSWLPQEGAVADSFWISLKYFNFYVSRWPRYSCSRP